MRRLTLIKSLLMLALCAAGLVACEGNVEVPTLMPSLPAAAQATPAKPAAGAAAGKAAPTQSPLVPPTLAIAPTHLPITTPVTATQIVLDTAATPIPDISAADIDLALEQLQQDVNAPDMTDVMSDSLEVSANEALNQLGQSLDSADTLSDVVK